jgi:hypothetical protein
MIHRILRLGLREVLACRGRWLLIEARLENPDIAR